MSGWMVDRWIEIVEYLSDALFLAVWESPCLRVQNTQLYFLT